MALATAKFPDDASDGWGRTIFETGVWMLHLFGGAIWIGGLTGLLLLALPGGVPAAERGAFWSAVIRRFSAVAMSSVAAIALSGLFLYWEHVDGPGQLLTTMYGRVLGVKILIFGRCCCSAWRTSSGCTPASRRCVRQATSGRCGPPRPAVPGPGRGRAAAR